MMCTFMCLGPQCWLLAGRRCWILAGPLCAVSHHLLVQPGLPFMVAGMFQEVKQEAARHFEAQAPELAQFHSCHILLVEINQKATLDSRGVAKELQNIVAIFFNQGQQTFSFFCHFSSKCHSDGTYYILAEMNSMFWYFYYIQLETITSR